ncbi:MULTISPECIES: PhzF family phenazine biosynthesis protein [Salinibaculum]|uniref:PhzF family phenazine biosynthesis protein n=1 Tax=Salinibaculum TaxID=2732368 RepID=UPI0030D005D8
MDTRQAVIVDACAAEPTGGVPVGLLPDGADLTDDQLQGVAGELAAATAVPDGDSLRVVGPTGPLDDHPAATVATVAFQHERGGREVGTDTLSTATGTVDVEVTSDGGVWVARPTPTVTESTVDEARIAAALGIDVAALRDVGADLPPLSLSVGRDVLAAPVNFLEHVSGADPDPVVLAEVAADADVDAVCAFTFDTLAADAACHARTFVPPGTDPGVRTVGLETPALPGLAGGLVAHLFERGVIEDATTSVEQGHFAERPGRVHVEAGGGLRVGGHAVTTLDGTVTVPGDEDDDIIEV